MSDGDGHASQAFINLELRIAGKPVAMRLEVPVEPVKPQRMLPVFRELVHQVVDRGVERAAERGERVSCGPGCGACCRQLVPIAPSEAHYVRDLVAAMPAAEREKVSARFAAAVRALEDADMLAAALDPRTLPPEDVEGFSLRYFGLGVACPFLVDDSCSIHPDRPLACREYLVSNDPAHCAAPSQSTIARIPIAREISRAVGRLDASLPPWLPLSTALAWAEANPDATPVEEPTTWLGRVLNPSGGAPEKPSPPEPHKKPKPRRGKRTRRERRRK